MPKIKRICHVCGKEYETCYTVNTTNAFRWQDVACSPECGAEYFRRVQVARGIIPDEKEEPKNVEQEIVRHKKGSKKKTRHR